MIEWKRQHRVPEHSKVFIIKGKYPDIRKALLNRGWVENEDKESKCFDFKWCTQKKDIIIEKLEKQQIVNHFAKSSEISTKAGLTNVLKNLIWFEADEKTFYPRCYDLRKEEEMDDFVE